MPALDPRLNARFNFFSGVNMRNRVLVVEHGMEACRTVREYLQTRGYEIRVAGSCSLAEQFCRLVRPDIVILAGILPDGSSHRFISRLKADEPSIPVIVLADEGSVGQAVEAIRLGAEQFLTKPVDLSALSQLVARTLQDERIRCRQLADSRTASSGWDPCLGPSDRMRALADQARNAASNDCPVLILGEAGTGKGCLARWLHQNSPRACEPYVDVKCGVASRDWLETELFGHEGVAAGSEEKRAGLLEVVHRGTAVINGIGQAGIQVQSRLLKLLTEKKLRRVAAARDRSVDVRLIATSHQPLPELVREKRFRGDLYFCLSRTTLCIPPLRERIEDVPALATQILGELATEIQTGDFGLAPDAQRALQRYSWPGNDQELRSVLERAVLLLGSAVLSARDLQLDAQSRWSAAENGSFLTLEQMEREYIEQVLRKEGGRVQSAAEKLGIPRSSLYHKLKQYQISRSALRSAS